MKQEATRLFIAALFFAPLSLTAQDKPAIKIANEKLCTLVNEVKTDKNNYHIYITENSDERRVVKGYNNSLADLESSLRAVKLMKEVGICDRVTLEVKKEE